MILIMQTFSNATFVTLVKFTVICHDNAIVIDPHNFYFSYTIVAK